MHRDVNGVVQHDWVNLDGGHYVFTTQPILSAQYLSWMKGDLVFNYQIEGEGTGSITSFAHKVVVYSW
jgi:hypothetical protein